MKARRWLVYLLTVLTVLCILAASGWADQWKISFNSYPGVMELNRSGTTYTGRFNLHGSWEQMLDLQVFRNAIYFRRASADQKYLGIMEGGRMQGVFTQHGSGRYPWTAEIAEETTTFTPPPNSTSTDSGISGGSKNMALKKKTRQSSMGYGGTSDRAVDGNRDGNFSANSITHTNNAPNEWWEVDLGTDVQINEIKIWNRTDCCGERLSNFYVLVSAQPFPSGNLQSLVNNSKIWKQHRPSAAGRETTIQPHTSGRYVRIQLAGQNWLSLAEVEVFGSPKSARIATGDQGADPVGTWRHSSSATWVITKNIDGTYFAQEHGLGNASGPGYFTDSGSFKIDYITRDGAVTGYYEVTFAPDGTSATGTVRELTGPRRSGSTNWSRIE